jgi:hypothetical protein
MSEQVLDVDNRDAKRRLALFRMMLAMRGAKIVSVDHDAMTVECHKGDEQGVRDLASKFGITLGGAS